MTGDIKRATRVGQAVLAGFKQGREKANAHKQARAAENLILVAEFLERDIQGGHVARGRAGRIARRSGFSVRYTQKLLARLYCRAKFIGYAPMKQQRGGIRCKRTHGSILI
jgi:hypothetical protein